MEESKCMFEEEWNKRIGDWIPREQNDGQLNKCKKTLSISNQATKTKIEKSLSLIFLVLECVKLWDKNKPI